MNDKATLKGLDFEIPIIDFEIADINIEIPIIDFEIADINIEIADINFNDIFAPMDSKGGNYE